MSAWDLLRRFFQGDAGTGQRSTIDATSTPPEQPPQLETAPVPDIWAHLMGSPRLADLARQAVYVPLPSTGPRANGNQNTLVPLSGQPIDVLIALLAAEHERGLTWNLAPFTLSGYTIKRPTDSDPDIVLFSVQITNDGAGNLDCYINTPFGDAARVKAGETQTFSYRTAKIQAIYLLPVSGSTPTVRITGTY